MKLIIGTLCLVLAASPTSVKALSSDELQRGLERQVTKEDAPLWTFLADMYAQRDFQPLWLGSREREENALAVLSIFADAAADGLDRRDYAISGGSEAEVELALSRNFVRFAVDLHSGRIAADEVDPDQKVGPHELPIPEVLFALNATPLPAALLRSFTPNHTAYRDLREELARLRQMQMLDGWPNPPKVATKLEEGDRGREVIDLRRFLGANGDLANPDGGPAFDLELAEAVRRFQQRHGLVVDGVVGRQTLAVMSVPLAERIRQIELNLERWRWMPDDLGVRHIMVNAADFRLRLVDGDRTLHETAVVVGKPYHRTPVFSADMTHVVLNPYWNVPYSIAVNELLPLIQKDPDILRNGRYELLDDQGRIVDARGLDWPSYSRGNLPFRFRQMPGEGNALGRIKFMLPNPHAVYLHDTPAKSLFTRTSRAFSHGCVRVSEPLVLAEYLLDDDWTEPSLKAAIDSGRRQTLNIAEPIPVHIVYFTAFVGEDGSLHFRPDIYGRDRRLAEALDSRHR